MFLKKTIKDIDLENKTVLLRADYNVPIKDGKILDDYRILQSIDTIKYLLSKNCKVIVCSHLGRPEGIDKKLSLHPVAIRLSKLLDKGVGFCSSLDFNEIKQELSHIKNGQVMLLENLRFFKGEEDDDKDLAKNLSELAEVFVQDAFGVVHRYHSSTVAITKYLPSVAGLLLEKEVDAITNISENPNKPLMVIIGGAKIADKIDILEKFIKSADFLAVGGAMGNTFLVASGHHIGDSVYDTNEVELAKRLMHLAEKESKIRGFKMQLPFDAVVTKVIDGKSSTRIVDWSTFTISEIESYPRPPKAKDSLVEKGEKIVDIGPFTAAYLVGVMNGMNSVIWNGTMGIAETPGLLHHTGPYAHGSELILNGLAGDFGHKPYSLVGGGDTAAFIQSKHLNDKINHLSTGGGASLELLGGHKLPGVESLMDK